MSSDSLHAIKQRVVSAFREGKLSSYDRQPPAGAALETLALAKRDTEALIAGGDTSPDVYRMLSLIQESLTQYVSAARTLEKLAANHTATRADLKRLALCRAAAAKQSSARSGHAGA